MRNAYINAASIISPQRTIDTNTPLDPIVVHENGILRALEPEYKNSIPGKYLRRMSRILKMGVYAAKNCLAQCNLENPDGIITGTGIGCLQDTEDFLENIYQHNETLVNPTRFIQSTHNTISAQIALMLKCYNYNFTFVHRGFSFESALMDGLMHLREKTGPQNYLIGGIDELTDTYIDITDRLKKWKTTNSNHLQLKEFYSKGSFPGEGAGFFVLSNEKKDTSLAQVLDLQMIFSGQNLQDDLSIFLERNGLSLDQIDFTLLGISGNKDVDKSLLPIRQELAQQATGYFKHLCGDFKTANVFGFWMGIQILRQQQVPDIVRLDDNPVPRRLSNVLLVNNYGTKNHSFILLKK